MDKKNAMAYLDREHCIQDLPILIVSKAMEYRNSA